jgi:hypothetical protein
MEQPKSKFPTMGNSAATTARNASAENLRGTLIKKKGNAKGATDPYVQAKPARVKVKATGGAAYGIRTGMPAWKDPSIGMTQGNGRLFTAALNRTKPNFDAGTTNYN